MVDSSVEDCSRDDRRDDRYDPDKGRGGDGDDARSRFGAERGSIDDRINDDRKGNRDG